MTIKMYRSERLNKLTERIEDNESTLPNGWAQGDFSKVGYGGQSPPPGKSHRYFFFKLYALDRPLNSSLTLRRTRFSWP